MTINFFIGNTVPLIKVRYFSIIKPWNLKPPIKILLKEMRKSLKSGEKEELRFVQKEPKKNNKNRGKYSYNQMDRLQQNNIIDIT